VYGGSKGGTISEQITCFFDPLTMMPELPMCGTVLAEILVNPPVDVVKRLAQKLYAIAVVLCKRRHFVLSCSAGKFSGNGL
jgi:hypothetical protein